MVGKIGDVAAGIANLASKGAGSPGAAVGKDFASFVTDAAKDAVNTMRTGEKMSIRGITGEADLNDVVAAVNNAELTLQTIVNLRDRLVQAYQEIVRMPI